MTNICFNQNTVEYDNFLRLCHNDSICIKRIGDFPGCNSCELAITDKNGKLLNDSYRIYGFTIVDVIRIESDKISNSWADYIDSCLAKSEYLRFESVTINKTEWTEWPEWPELIQICYNLKREDILQTQKNKK